MGAELINNIPGDQPEGTPFHYHPSRYPHCDGSERSAICCYGQSELECRVIRASGELSRMMEFELRKTGFDVFSLTRQHMAQNPEDWPEL